MKKNLLLFTFAALAFTGCQKYKNKEVYANVPVYMDYTTFRQSFSFEKDVAIQGAGNIYIYNQYIFLSEEDKGIHVINNSNPASPEVEGFMNIPGNTQMAVKGNYLYANSFIDLLVIDISNIADPKQVNRLNDVFSYATPATNDAYPVADVHSDRGVVIGWKIEKTKEVSGWGAKFFVSDCPECEQTEMTTKSASSLPTTLGGSMSKFTIYDNNLYVVDDNNLMTFDITQASQPGFRVSRPTWRTCETIFEKDGYLYMGTTNGMVIYDAKNMPDDPQEVSEVTHVEACDPVIVAGDYAYVTLRTGSECGGDINELQVIDVSNKNFPVVKKHYDMNNPHGLAFDNNLLFLCDGDAGLKIFDASDPKKVGQNLLYTHPGINATDLIMNNGLAVLISEHAIYQYNYSNPANLQIVSSLEF